MTFKYVIKEIIFEKINRYTYTHTNARARAPIHTYRHTHQTQARAHILIYTCAYECNLSVIMDILTMDTFIMDTLSSPLLTWPGNNLSKKVSKSKFNNEKKFSSDKMSVNKIFIGEINEMFEIA